MMAAFLNSRRGNIVIKLCFSFLYIFFYSGRRVKISSLSITDILDFVTLNVFFNLKIAFSYKSERVKCSQNEMKIP